MPSNQFPYLVYKAKVHVSKMLEICVDTIESVRAAAAGGADRIELCSSLAEGGLTPTLGMLRIVKRHFPSLIVFVMLRPRGGGDFLFSDLEFEALLEDLREFSEHGADGFVFGALNADRTINEVQSRRVVEAAGVEHPVTFHRAFDLTDPDRLEQSFRLVRSMGYRRLLSSGLAPSAELGASRLRQMVVWSADKADDQGELVVVAGAGIGPSNAERVLVESGCREFHGSARRSDGKTSDFKANGVDFGNVFHSDESIVRELVRIGRKTIGV